MQHVGESCTSDLHTYEEQASAGHASLKPSSIKVSQLALVRQKHLQANLTYIRSLLARDPSVLSIYITCPALPFRADQVDI